MDKTVTYKLHGIMTIFGNINDPEAVDSREIEGIYFLETDGFDTEVQFHPTDEAWKEASLDCGWDPEDLYDRCFGIDIGIGELDGWDEVHNIIEKTRKMNEEE